MWCRSFAKEIILSKSDEVAGPLTSDQAYAAMLTGPVLVLVAAGTTLTAGVAHRTADASEML